MEKETVDLGNELECIICLDIVETPKETTCCNQLICEPCVQKLK